MRLYLFRHAHRDAFTPVANNGLSERGKEQAYSILEKVESGTLPKPSLCLVSPKLRAQETLAVVCETFNVPLKVYPDLDEQKEGEDSSTFFRRVQKCMKSIAEDFSSELVVFACSHLDFLELADPLHRSFSPAQYIELQWEAPKGWKIRD